MIGLEGLLLLPEDWLKQGVYFTFGQYIHKGLIPNLFPEGQHEGMYNTADATLWFSTHSIVIFCIVVTGKHFSGFSILSLTLSSFIWKAHSLVLVWIKRWAAEAG